MVSRADSVSAAPTLGRALRSAASDFYFNSWRLVPANLVWGAAFLIILVSASIAPALVLLAPLLALPTVGIFRIAALITRGENVSFWDGLVAWRDYAVPTILLGVGLAGCALVFATNVVVGLASGNALGWTISTLAFWGLVATWVVAWTAWPLLVDPARRGKPVRGRLRVALLLILAHPVRMLALGALLAVLLAASTVAFAALVTISVAFAALVACRYVLPAADRLEARLRD